MAVELNLKLRCVNKQAALRLATAVNSILDSYTLRGQNPARVDESLRTEVLMALTHADLVGTEMKEVREK